MVLLRFLNNLLRSVLLFLLRKPVLYFAKKYASSPDKQRVFESLTKLYKSCLNSDSKNSSYFEMHYSETKPVILFSDHHKGNRKGNDEFTHAETNYLNALDYYNTLGASYISLGDSEEFWKFNIFSIIQHNKKTFDKEDLFHKRGAFYKIFGNHDIFWDMDPLAPVYLKQLYHKVPKIYPGIVIRIFWDKEKYVDIFCTHGHQGDRQSDGNWFSKWFVSYIWAPLQLYLRININTPSHNNYEKTLHNQIMYEWSEAQNNIILITGHTHQPVFNSLSHLERLYKKLNEARASGDDNLANDVLKEIPRRKREYDFVHHDYSTMKPSYFNAGCCCYSDGTITGIEIADGKIRLVKWVSESSNKSKRIIAEEAELTEVVSKLIHFQNS